MNTKQKIISLIGVLIIFFMGLFPPWKYIDENASVYREIPADYYLIFAPPEPDEEEMLSIQLDISRLAIQWITVLFVMGAIIYIFHDKKEDLDSDEDMEDFELD